MRNSLAAPVNEPWRTKLANARSGADKSITFTHTSFSKHIFFLWLRKCDNGGPVAPKGYENADPLNDDGQTVGLCARFGSGRGGLHRILGSNHKNDPNSCARSGRRS